MQIFKKIYPLPVDHWSLKAAWFIFFLCLPGARDIIFYGAFVMIGLGLLACTPKQFLQNIKANPSVLLLGSLYVLHLIGMLYTDDRVRGWHFIEGQQFQLWIPIICLLTWEHLKLNVQRYLYLYIWTISIAALGVIIFFFLPWETGEYLIETIPLAGRHNSDPFEFGMYVPYMERIQFSNLVSIAVFFCLYLIGVNYKKKSLIVFTICLILFSIFLGGRAGTLSLFAGLFVFGLSFITKQFSKRIAQRYTSKMVKPIVWFSSVILMLLIALFTYQIPAVKQRYQKVFNEYELFESGKVLEQPKHITRHQTVVRRLVAYENFWTAIVSNNWLIGVGTGDHYKELWKVYKEDAYSIPHNMHSQYLLIWLCLGLTGLLIFLAVWFYATIKIVQNKSTRIIGLAVLVFYILNFAADGILFKQTDSVLFPLTLSFLILIPQSKNQLPSGK